MPGTARRIWGAWSCSGPPNKGSELVDAFAFPEPFRRVSGPAGLEPGIGPGSTPNRLERPDFEPGVIAGDRSLNPFHSALIEGPDDGKVAVHATRVPGMDDHIVLPVTHTFMMHSPIVFGQVIEFLESGRFRPDMRYAEAAKRMLGKSGELAEQVFPGPSRPVIAARRR